MSSKARTIIIASMITMLSSIAFAGYTRAADPYEPNNSPDTAWLITSGTYMLSLDMGDADYFNITLTTGYTITIDVTTGSSVSVNLQGPSGQLGSTGATPSTPGHLVYVATYTGNHTILATNGVPCTYIMVIAVTPPPSTPGFDVACTIGFSIAAILVVYVMLRPKLRNVA